MELLIDYGGTYFRYTCCGESGKLLSRDVNLIEFIEEKINKYHIKRVGVGFAGQVNNGKIMSSPNIKGLDGLDLAGYFKRFGVDVLLENDLKCAAVYESKFFKTDHIAVIYIGTGMGAAFVDNGFIVRGHDNLAGEIGHVPYKETPFTCGCGKNNCLELTCSGKALRLRNINNLSQSSYKNEFNAALNYAIELVSVLLNPELIVLGGGVVEHNKLEIKPNLPKFSRVNIEFSKAKDAVIEGLRILLNREGSDGE